MKDDYAKHFSRCCHISLNIEYHPNPSYHLSTYIVAHLVSASHGWGEFCKLGVSHDLLSEKSHIRTSMALLSIVKYVTV